MAGAGLLVLFAAVGVNFGWQPMPDGSARYEYVVQLEPEVAATLADGKSIPIVSEVPEEIQPVARVRVIVGKGDLPRQRLVTRLKPADTSAESSAAAGKKDDDVALAQYNQYSDQRYGQTPPAQSPPQASQTGGTTEWNSGGADAPITPTAGGPAATQQTAGGNGGAGGAATTWNNGGQAPPAAGGPLSRLGENLQQAAGQPLRQGLEKADERLRNAGDKIGSRTRELVDNLSKPFNGSQAAPPVATSAQGAEQWNSPAGSAASSTAAGSNGTSMNWNGPSGNQQAPLAAGGEAPRYGQAASSGLGAAANPQTPIEWNNSGANPIASRNGNGAPPLATGKSDPFAAAPDPRLPAGQAATGSDPSWGFPNIADRSEKTYGGAGSAWPGIGTPIPELGPTPYSQTQQPNVEASAGPSAATTGAPEIRIGMLSTPADQPLEGTAATSQSTPTGFGSPQAKEPAFGAKPDATAASWPTTQTAQTGGPGSQGAANAPPARTAGNQSAQTQAPPTGRDNTAIVLAAWVLLTGSVAGNLYLFWSYVDVRQKYRVLVRKTARAVGRYTPG
jgi:hypothetical protein